MRLHCPHKVYVTFWTISIRAVSWLSWHFILVSSGSGVFFFSFLTLYKSCDILVGAERIADGWMDGWLLFVFLSLVDLLFYTFLHYPHPPLQSA